MEKLIAEVATLKENARWQNNKLETIERKVDGLVDQRATDKYFKGKVVGIITVLSSALCTNAGTAEDDTFSVICMGPR